MSIDFFKKGCTESPISEQRFGLCDDQNGTKAYTDTINPNNWIAIVKNENRTVLNFTAIDKCVIKDHEYPERGRCDVMLTSKDHIYFVELKKERYDWIQGAIEQLESTIQFFIENHDITRFKHKKAFACNKRHTRFAVIDNELNLRFFKMYGVRIDAQAKIIVI